MKMLPQGMSITDWAQVDATEHLGTIGKAIWKTRMFQDIRVRMMEYSPGYAADHWCTKGHVLLCLSGYLVIELGDGARMRLEAGQSYHVGDGEPGHRSSAPEGAKLFVVD
jgi:hypothetical protein